MSSNKLSSEWLIFVKMCCSLVVSACGRDSRREYLAADSGSLHSACLEAGLLAEVEAVL